jgi:hypothetical protein
VLPLAAWRAAQGAPVGAPSAYCRGGVEEPKGCDGKKEEDGDADAALPHAVAPAGVPSAYCCGSVEEKKECDGEENADGLY